MLHCYISTFGWSDALQVLYIYQQYFRFRSLKTFVFWGTDDGDGGGSVVNGVVSGCEKDDGNGCGVSSFVSDLTGAWERCDDDDNDDDDDDDDGDDDDANVVAICNSSDIRALSEFYCFTN